MGEAVSSRPDVSLITSVFRSERYMRRLTDRMAAFADGLADHPDLSVELVLVLNGPSSLELRR
jgi:hypothetical protein